VRDSMGLFADTITGETGRIKHVAVRNEVYATSLLVKRAALLIDEKVLDEAALDRYSFIRDAYLQHRQSLVYDGNPPREKYDDEEDDSKPDVSKPEVKPDHGASDSTLQEVTSASVEIAPVSSPVATASLPIEPAVTAQTAVSPAPQPAPPVIRVWVAQSMTVH